MSDEELKSIVAEVVTAPDPFWIENAFYIVKRIVEMPDGTETTIAALVRDDTKPYTNFLFEMNAIVTEVCKRIGIELDKSKYAEQFLGMPFNIPFVKKSDILKRWFNKSSFFILYGGAEGIWTPVQYSMFCNIYKLSLNFNFLYSMAWNKPKYNKISEIRIMYLINTLTITYMN